MNKSFEEMGREAARVDIRSAAMAFNTNRPFAPKESPFMEGSLAYLQWKAGYDAEQRMIDNLARAAFAQ